MIFLVIFLLIRFSYSQTLENQSITFCPQLTIISTLKKQHNMQKYIAPIPGVEISGDAILGFINCMRKGKDKRRDILKNNGIINPEAGGWYDYQGYLNSQKEIHQTIGEMNLFLIGAKTTESAMLPPIDNLKEALSLVNIAAHMNIRLNGEVTFNPETGVMLDGVGDYLLADFNEKERSAVMVSTYPTSSKFDQGIFTAFVYKYKPLDSTAYEVELDLSKETRATGGDSCTYLVKW